LSERTLEQRFAGLCEVADVVGSAADGGGAAVAGGRSAGGCGGQGSEVCVCAFVFTGVWRMVRLFTESERAWIGGCGQREECPKMITFSS